MNPTDSERAAARRLADATLEYAIAREDGRAWRQGERRRPLDDGRGRAPPARQWLAPDGSGPVQLLLTAKEAAAALGISERLLWSLSAPRGPLPVVRLGGAVRYPVAELERAIRGMVEP